MDQMIQESDLLRRQNRRMPMRARSGIRTIMKTGTKIQSMRRILTHVCVCRERKGIITALHRLLLNLMTTQHSLRSEVIFLPLAALP